MDRKNKVFVAAAIGAAAILVASSVVRCAATRTVESAIPDTPGASQQAEEEQEYLNSFRIFLSL